MFLGGHGFNILIRIFQRNENKFISLVLKAKQQKAIQLVYISLNFLLINSPINLYFFIFQVYET